MSNPISKLNQLDLLRPQDLNCNIFSVYDYDSFSIQELLCVFFEKINQCVEISNATFKLAEWLVSVGLAQEVAKKLEVWLADGTLKEIINETIFKELNEKINLTKDIDPDTFTGSDLEKLQKSLDYSINNGYKPIKILRDYDITGGTLIINKDGEFPRNPIRLLSFGGSISKHDEGFMFTGKNKNCGDLFISNIKFKSTSGANTKVFDVSKLIRINSVSNYYLNIDYPFYDGTDYAQSIRCIDDYFVYCKCVFKFRYVWDLHIQNCLCEESEKFIEDDQIEKHYISNNISISDCVVENLKSTLISLNGTHALNISNNYFELNEEYIKLGQYGASGCNISNNFFYDNRQDKKRVCVNITGGNARNYSLVSNYVSGNLELANSSLNDVTIYNLGNHIQDGAVLSSNTNIIKEFYEKTELKGKVSIRENCGIKQINVQMPYFELNGGESNIVELGNIYNIKYDDIVTVQHTSLSDNLVISQPRLSSDKVTVKVTNGDTQRLGCNMYINILKINKVNAY